MASENKYINAMTPMCELRFMYLGKQDTKFDPKYSVDMVFDTTVPEHRTFITQFMELNKKASDELLAELPPKGKKDWKTKDIFKTEEDAEGNATGKLILKATTKDKPIVKDAEGKTLADSFVITLGNGTVGRVKLCLKKSKVDSRKTLGLAVYMSTFGGSVQIKDPVFYSGGSAEGGTGGFDKVDGFVAPAENDNGDKDF